MPSPNKATRIAIAALVTMYTSVSVHGLRPAPCEDQVMELPSGVRLEVDAENWVSKVFAADGSLMYEMDVIPCREDKYMSDDGSLLVFDGNFYFPHWMRDPNTRQDTDVTISTVYQYGVKAREVMYFADLNGELIPEDSVDDFDLPRAYGYVDRQFTIGKIAWDNNEIVYYGQDEVAVPLLILDADGPDTLRVA